jgi:predicted transcriptional regulator
MVSLSKGGHMTTTSLKLPEEVKQLAVAAAQQHGVTPHAFMVEAIRAAAIAAERRAVFVADAQAARAEALESGKAFDADDVHVYLRARAQGQAVPRPKARTWRG